jgi:hypothetical protein
MKEYDITVTRDPLARLSPPPPPPPPPRPPPARPGRSRRGGARGGVGRALAQVALPRSGRTRTRRRRCARSRAHRLLLPSTFPPSPPLPFPCNIYIYSTMEREETSWCVYARVLFYDIILHRWNILQMIAHGALAAHIGAVHLSRSASAFTKAASRLRGSRKHGGRNTALQTHQRKQETFAAAGTLLSGSRNVALWKQERQLDGSRNAALR